jgi:hypothetical protein
MRSRRSFAKTFLGLGLAFVNAVVACASSSDPSTSSGSAPGQADGSAPEEAASSPETNDAGAADAASPGDARADGSDALQPTPPTGATLCGKGTFKPADVRKACKTPVNFGPAPADGCDLTTSNGGRYEVWCTANTTYIWAEIDELRATPASCPVSGDFDLSPNADYAYSGSGGVAAGPAKLVSSGKSPYPLGSGRSFALTASLGHATGGSMTLWAKGSDSVCPTDPTHPGALVAGALVTW